MQRETLTPASVISMLLSGFPASGTTDPDMQMGAYLIAAEGSTLESMFRAMKAYLQNRVKRDNATFAPSAAEFADQCRYQQLVIDGERRPKIAAPAEAPRERVSAEKMRLLALARKGDRSAALALKGMGYAIELPEEQERAA